MGWLHDDRRTRAAWRRYGAALLLVLAAALASAILHPWLMPAPLALFFAAVAFSAWYGGAGPAVTAIAVSLAPISLIALEPVGVWSLGAADRAAMIIFVLVSAVLVLLSASRDRTEAALQASDGRHRGILETATAAEKALGASRERPRLAQEAANVAIWDWDAVSGQTFWSETMWSLFELEPGSAAPGHALWLSRVHDDDRPRIESSLARRLASDAVEYHDEFRVARPDGAERWIDVVARIVRDEVGAPLRMSGVNIDITDRNRAEEATHRARARAEALAEATRVLTETSLGPEAVLAAVARQAAAQLGDLAVVRLLSTDGRWLEAAAVDHPDPVAREAASAALAMERHPANEGANGAALAANRVQRLSGEALAAARQEGTGDLWPALPAAPTAALLAAPLRANGRAIGSLSVSRAEATRPYVAEDEHFLQELADRAGLAIERARLFTRIRASEERIRLAVETNRMVTWEWDPVADRTTSSDNFAAIYGLPALAGSDAGVALIWPEDLPAHQEHVSRITREGGEYQSRFRITRPSDGEMAWLEERAAALSDDAGRVTRVVGVVTDVTARMVAEEAVQESEARLRALLDQLPVAIGLTDEQGRWVLTNAQMGRFAGDVIPSRDPDRQMHWQTWDEAGQPIAPMDWPAARALRGETTPGMDFLHTSERGEECWTRVSAAPFHHAAGAVIGAINVIQDIDARKRAEDALATSEARARFVAGASAVLAASLDYDEAVNQVVRLAVPTLADWCVIDLLGADDALHRLAIVHGDPERAAVAVELKQRYAVIPAGANHTAWNVLGSGQTWFDPDVARTRFVDQARDEAHLALLEGLGFASELVTPLVARGRALGVLTLVYGASGRHHGVADVALAEELARHCALALDNARLYREARDAEAKISRLFEAGVIGLFVADPERIVEANDHFLGMVGYTREELTAGHLRWREMTPPEYAELDTNAIAEIAERGFCTPFEKAFIRKDGTRVPILIGTAELERDPPLWIGCVLDLTIQKAAEEDRVAFVDAATHDLKNPLTSLKGRVQLLLRRARRAETLDAAGLESGLAAIDADASRMVTLIDELMDAAHMRTGRRLTLNPFPTDLVALARECAEQSGRAATAHVITLDSTEPVLVGAWDQPRLERVVQNLLDNAIKYSPRGGRIVVRVSRENGPDDQDWAVLTVRDYGVGIPAADLPHVFERFRRGGNVGAIVGAGIGLAGVRQIVAQHGGTIAVESVEGQGSIFTVGLPLLPPEMS